MIWSPRAGDLPSTGALLLVGALLLTTGCATGSLSLEEGSGPETRTPWRSCASPAQFIQWQQGVDMPRLLEGMEDWEAVRLGALGPVREDAAGRLNRARAAFLSQVSEDYGTARAEVFALFVLHSAYDDDVKEVLGLLARDKLLGRTLGLMPTVREELKQRGLRLEDTPERDFQWSDLARGVASAGVDILDSSPARDGGKGFGLFLLREQLPAPYQRAFDGVEHALWQGHLSPEHVALGVFDHLTFGVPLGLYHLMVGVGHGMQRLTQGEYEQATRELTPALLVVTLHVGGKALGRLAEHEAGVEAGLERAEPLEALEQRSSALRLLARHLEEVLGVEGVRELAREIQARREAGRLVAVGGEAAAMALHEARGDVARAQVLMSRARPEAGGDSPGRSAKAGRGEGPGVGRPGGLESLVDAEAGLTAEVLAARLAQAELEAAGPRLPGNVKGLEKQRPQLDAPPREARANPRWREYVGYYEKRLAEVREGKTLEGPLRWEAYEQLRGVFQRGLLFEQVMVERLRADASLPRAQRRYLGDFDKPRIERSVGVSKPGTGLRFADVLVIEEGEPAGRVPRVETFSFKSRDLAPLEDKELRKQFLEDSREALRNYGEALDIRRASLKSLLQEGGQVQIRRVRLIYEGGRLRPTKAADLKTVLSQVQARIPGVEVVVE